LHINAPSDQYVQRGWPVPAVFTTPFPARQTSPVSRFPLENETQVGLARALGNRNKKGFINRAHYQNTTFVLLKNSTPLARIVPDHATVCTGGNLAAVLKETDLSAKEARAWYRDLQMARRKLKAPVPMT
jgi:hypothetical protein